MKFKELKPGMVIHCCDDNDMDNLLKELERLGYKWYCSGTNPTHNTYHPYPFNVLHLYDMDDDRDYKHITYSLVCKPPEGSLSYSDIIIEEPELSAEEILFIVNEICREHSYSGENCHDNCPFSHDEFCTRWRAEHPEETIKACLEWKEAHEELEKVIQPKICRERYAVKCLEDACYESQLFEEEEAAIKFAKIKAKEKIFEGGNRSFYVVKVYTFVDYKEEEE